MHAVALSLSDPLVGAHTMLTVVCWLWGNGYTGSGWRPVYTARRVNAFARMFRANCTLPYRMVCITDMPEGITECDTYPLWHEWPNLARNGVPNCFRRLRLFDQAFTRDVLGAERVLHIDLDCVILKNIDDLLSIGSTPGLRIVKGLRTTRYNGSMYLIEPGAYQRLWDDFDPAASPLKLKELRTPEGKKIIGSDQAWISTNVDDAATFSAEDGVYQLGQWSRTPELERRNARMVFFAGGFKPWHKHICRRPYKADLLYQAYQRYCTSVNAQAA